MRSKRIQFSLRICALRSKKNICDSQHCLIDTSLLNFGNAKRLCLFCLMRQKHCWNYFAFNQSYLAKGKIATAVLLPHEAKQKYMILHCQNRTGSDRRFSKICETGQDRIQFYQIRTGLGLKNFTVRSLVLDSLKLLDIILEMWAPPGKLSSPPGAPSWCSTRCGPYRVAS